jgi:hypothetical protein
VVRAESVLATALIALVVALMSVGVLSHTPIRHAIQVVPGIVVLGLALRRHRCARSAAMAVFGFWLVIMALIWLYLLGVARVVSGHFTGGEVALTLVIGLASAVGLVAASLVRDSCAWPARLAAFAAAAALQVGAMWLSLQTVVAAR